MPKPSLNPPADTEAVRIGATVRALREAYGLTAAELARAVGVTVGRIYQVESGRCGMPGVILLRKIADAIGVKLAAIVVKDYNRISRDAAAEAEADAEAAA